MVRPIMAGLSAFKRDVAFKKYCNNNTKNSDKLTEFIAIFVF
ncbi:hypothetical protein SPWS13_1766 [Shewanella putrefaciens]|nr:hypothetical protein SPWS13_1766 [Shewanella putrefaciens]